MKMQVRVEGIEELSRAIEDLRREMAGALEAGVDEAAQMAVPVVRSNAPEGPTRNLKKAVRTKKLPPRPGMPSVTMVGLDYGIAPHQSLVEFGSGQRYHASGKYVGQMPATGFFRKSIRQIRSLVRGAITARVREPIDRRR